MRGERYHELLRRGMEWQARHDFMVFLEKCFMTLHPGQTFLPNWHLEVLADHLERCASGHIRRLIINLPPRSLKSLMISIAWPAFLLGRDPGLRILSASYAQPLATRHSAECRKIIKSRWYQRLFPATHLTRDQNQKHRFTTTHHGHRIATSIQGGITGEGGNVLIVDDPQHPLQVRSAQKRRDVTQWFDQTFSSRLDDKNAGVMIVVMQRLHEEDLTGHLLEKGGWEHVCLPAIATEETLYQTSGREYVREVGDILHPAREDWKLLNRARKDLGEHAFMAQYQQQPIPQAGRMLKKEWLRYYTSLPEGEGRIVQSWDTAIKTGAEHDATACITLVEHGTQIYVLDVFVGRLDYPSLKKAVKEQAKKWNPHVVLIEDKASGQSLIQDIRHELKYPVIPMMPKQDKVARFAAATALFEAGDVHLPTDNAMTTAFERELLAFPEGGHDDQVDAFSQYVSWRRNNAGDPTLRSF